MISVGLIGYGYWGRNLARVINDHPKLSLIAICEIDELQYGEIEEKYPLSDYCSTLDELKKHELDAVFICTPTSTHCNLVLFCLDMNVHVFCEKPVAINTAEIALIKTKAKERKKHVMAGHIFEFNSIIVKIKELIDEGAIGDILYIAMNRTGLGPIRQDVNVVYDLATHDISILNFLLNQAPIEVSAHGSCFMSEHIEDVAFINLSYKNNMKASINVSWLEAKKERIIKIVGTQKMVIFDDTSLNEKLKIYQTGTSYQKFNGDFGTFQLSLTDGDITIPNVEYKEPLQTEINHFVNVIEGLETNRTGLENAEAVALTLERIQKSLKSI